MLMVVWKLARDFGAFVALAKRSFDALFWNSLCEKVDAEKWVVSLVDGTSLILMTGQLLT